MDSLPLRRGRPGCRSHPPVSDQIATADKFSSPVFLRVEKAKECREISAFLLPQKWGVGNDVAALQLGREK